MSCTSTHYSDSSKEVGLKKVFSQFLAPSSQLFTVKRSAVGKADVSWLSKQHKLYLSNLKQGKGRRKGAQKGTRHSQEAEFRHLSASRDAGCATASTVITHHRYMCLCDCCGGGNRDREALSDRAFEKLHSPRSIYKELTGETGLLIAAY